MATDPLQQIAEELNDDLKTLANLERQISKETNKMDRAVKKVAKPSLRKINKLKKSVQKVISRTEAKANDNRPLLTNGNTKKTISLQAGTISWRDGTSLVFDVNDTLLLKTIRLLRKTRAFVTWKPIINKTAIKKDDEFVAELAKRGAAHLDLHETMSIEPNMADGTVIKDDNPYKITLPREE